MPIKRKELFGVSNIITTVKNWANGVFAPKSHTHSSYLTSASLTNNLRLPAPKFSSQIAYLDKNTLSYGYYVPADCYVQIIMSGYSGYESMVYFTVSGYAVAQAGICVGAWRDDCCALIPVCNGSLIRVTGDIGHFTIYARLFSYWK